MLLYLGPHPALLRGQVWGATTRDECIATVRDAVLVHGISHLDLAPMYGADREAERVIVRCPRCTPACRG